MIAELTAEEARAALLVRLQARRAEIEQAALTRVHAISTSSEVTDPAYADGLRAAVSTALDYGFAAIEQGERRAPSFPPLLLAQARLAARNGVDLHTVLRRYFAGYSLLGDFLIEEADRSDAMDGSELKRLLRTQAVLFDRLIAAVSDEHSREADSRWRTIEQRRVERVERLLGGELLDTSDLAYEFDLLHIGLVATGAAAAETIRELGAALDCRLLLVRPDPDKVWGWLGRHRSLDTADVEQYASEQAPFDFTLAIGEPSRGIAGWRLSHYQAAAALAIPERREQSVVRYADVALLASAIRDDLLVRSLHQLYLAPLEASRGLSEMARETLRAYFDADRNISSAAALLAINRNTVAKRLLEIEKRIGRPVASCAAELEILLQLEDL